MNRLKIILLLTLITNIDVSHSSEVPENSYKSGSNWFCNNGYRKQGNKCNKITVPANAYVSGSNWFCNLGYKKQKSQCIEMNAAEKELQQKQIAAIRSKARNENIDGQSFSLRDIERKCEAFKYSDSYGDIECSGSKFRIVERKCEAYFSDSTNGELECSGELRSISGDCSIDMYSDNYGELSC